MDYHDDGGADGAGAGAGTRGGGGQQHPRRPRNSPLSGLQRPPSNKAVSGCRAKMFPPPVQKATHHTVVLWVTQGPARTTTLP
ncbi:uncharacterized protein LOC126999780 isoform X3 [Eriocheir sinensis]|uniref:uncharacterized protein LOC126999780 isoform X3 n=1 Tax=Eriocheir sinensis TaxID=95602 RepID=UPI0021C76D34|nr:uncharacterized protein LOC126999780 isoform X3 [Eriocheir sinensis]